MSQNNPLVSPSFIYDALCSGKELSRTLAESTLCLRPKVPVVLTADGTNIEK